MAQEQKRSTDMTAQRRDAAARASQRRSGDPQQRDASLQDGDDDVSATRPRKPGTPEPALAEADDPVDQASIDSFPASDPPAHSSRRAIPGGKRE